MYWSAVGGESFIQKKSFFYTTSIFYVALGVQQHAEKHFISPAFSYSCLYCGISLNLNLTQQYFIFLYKLCWKKNLTRYNNVPRSLRLRRNSRESDFRLRVSLACLAPLKDLKSNPLPLWSSEDVFMLLGSKLTETDDDEEECWKGEVMGEAVSMEVKKQTSWTRILCVSSALLREL